MTSDEIQQLMKASFDSSLKKSVHDATAELVDTFVKANIHEQAKRLLADTGILGAARPAAPQLIGTGVAEGDMDAVTGWLQKGRDDEEEDERAKLDQRLTQRGNGDIGVPKALTQDPFLALDQMGYRERPSGLSYRMLNEMGRKCPPVTAIIQTRVNQVAACADPQPDDHSVGVKIVLADRRAKMTPDLQREGDRILDWVLHCGNPDVKRRRFNLGHYLRASTADSLILDQLNTEIVNDRKGRPSWWHAVDAATIRLVDDLDDDDDSEDTVRYVQVYEDTIVAEFTEREMLFGIRNPRTDIRVGGYGFSELEMLVTIVTALLWAQDYNSAFFKQGTVAKGILNFKGAIPDKELISFRRQWYAMISGIANAWRTPVVNSEDLQWINMQQSSREMEFAAFIDWLLKVACFPAGTSVTMADGTRREIQDVRPGDFVRTHDGGAGRVANTQAKRHSGHVVCVQAGGRTTRATPEHPFFAATSKLVNMKRVFDAPSWVKAGDLCKADHHLVVPKPAKREGPFTERIDLTRYVECDADETSIRLNANRVKDVARYIDLTEENAFALGLFFAEGHAGDYLTAFAFHADETEYADAASRFLERLGCAARRVPVADTAGVLVRAHGGALSRALRTMFAGTSATKRVPEEIRTASPSVQRSFISGVVAGDGSVWSTEKSIGFSISSISEDGLYEIQSMMLENDVFAACYSQERTSLSFGKCKRQTSHSLRVGGRQLLSLATWLTGPKGDLLREKLRVVQETPTTQGSGLKTGVYDEGSYFLVPIAKLWTESYDDDVFNFEVEGKHTYVVNQLAVHNCGVFLIAPEEIGFQFGNGGQTSALSEGSQGDKLKYSKDKGLVPLVKFHAENLNQIVRRVDPRFRAEFAGINSRTAEDLIKLQKEEVSTIKTIDEARMERGMKPLSNGRGDIILNPVFQAATQAAQAQAAGGAPAGGAPPGQGFDRGGLEDGDQDDQDDDGEDPYRQGDDDEPEEKEIQKSAAPPKRGRRVLNLEVDL